ncbi:MAG: hypothetical protein WBC13_01065, partial [Dokdonella sp.]
VTTRHLHSSRTGSAKAADYHIVFKDGQYKVFDKAQRFRLSFATMPAAQSYIESRTARSTDNNALSQQEVAA